jgi:integrase/recombinase XerD
VDAMIVEQLGKEHPLARHLDDFLIDAKNANASRHTLPAYRGDLLQFTAPCDDDLAHLTADPIRAFLADIGELSPATRKRKRAAVSSFCKWAVRHDLLGANPMDKIAIIKVPETLPRPAKANDVAKVLNSICSRRPRKDVPLDVLRDRVLFETTYVAWCRTRPTSSPPRCPRWCQNSPTDGVGSGIWLISRDGHDLCSDSVGGVVAWR